MSYYIRLSDNKYPVTYSQLKQANPNMSIPKSPTDEQLLPLGYANVEATQKPVDSHTYVAPDPLPPGYVAPSFYDAYAQKVTEGIPFNNGSEYVQVWTIIALTQPEVDDRIEAAKIVKKEEVMSEVITQINSFYQSEDLTQARVRDQITAKYNTYSRLLSPTQDEIDYMVNTDAVTDYTTSIYDDLIAAGIVIDSLTTEQAVIDYTFNMPPLPAIMSYKLMAVIGAMSQ